MGKRNRERVARIRAGLEQPRVQKVKKETIQSLVQEVNELRKLRRRING